MLPTADPNKAEIIELNIAVMAFADVPEQHRFAEAIIGRLGKGARARNCAAAVVEPIADDMPARNVAYPALRSDAMAKTIAGFGDAVRALPSTYSRTGQARCRRAPPATALPLPPPASLLSTNGRSSSVSEQCSSRMW
jgi:hypothetical protein